MIDEEETRVDPRDHAGDERYGEALLYDFAKAMTSLSIIVLGGVLTLSGTEQAEKIPVGNLVMVAGLIAGGGIFAFSTAHAIVDARMAGKAPRRNLSLTMKVAAALFSIGVGAFMMMWLKQLR